MKIEELRMWELVSSKLCDGAECLTLKCDGRSFCEYAPGRFPYNNIWHQYFNGFPLQAFQSRDACIVDAGRIAGQKLEVNRESRS